MKTIALTLFAAALGFAQDAPKVAPKVTITGPKKPSLSAMQTKAPPPAVKKPQQKTAAPAPPVTIPAGAVQVEPYLYRYTDSKGKTWNYRKTPFGISKWEEGSIPTPAPTAAKNESVVVTDLGDSYRFEKKTPFGGSTWVHKKTDLTNDDKALLDRSDGTSTSPAKAQVSQVANKTKEEK